MLPFDFALSLSVYVGVLASSITTYLGVALYLKFRQRQARRSGSSRTLEQVLAELRQRESLAADDGPHQDPYSFDMRGTAVGDKEPY